MKISIQRYDKNKEPKTIISEYQLENTQNTTLLKHLINIKHKTDNSLTFRAGCKSGICGCCAVRVNGVERLACKCSVSDGDKIEPLKNYEVVRDLVVDSSKYQNKIKDVKGYLSSYSNSEVSSEDEKRIDRQSNCILCQSCYSSCPVFEVNKDFLGPYALTKALRYTNDVKEADKKNRIDAIQKNGIWDCTLCGNCTLVCPESIDPKTDIMNLRFKSSEYGYSDPNAQSFGFDSGNFGGFNPNF